MREGVKKRGLIDRYKVVVAGGWNILSCLLLHRLIHRGQRDFGAGPFTATKDVARTHIPVCFRSSTQAQSQGFPLSMGEKGATISPPLDWGRGWLGYWGGGTPVIQPVEHFLIEVSQEVRILLCCETRPGELGKLSGLVEADPGRVNWFASLAIAALRSVK